MKPTRGNLIVLGLAILCTLWSVRLALVADSPSSGNLGFSLVILVALLAIGAQTAYRWFKDRREG